MHQRAGARRLWEREGRRSLRAIERHRSPGPEPDHGPIVVDEVRGRQRPGRYLNRELEARPMDGRVDKQRALVNDDDRLKAVKDIQKYLADKLGPLVKVSPAAIDKTLTGTERSRVAELTQRVAKLNGRKQAVGKIQGIWEPAAKAPPTYVLRRGNCPWVFDSSRP